MPNVAITLASRVASRSRMSRATRSPCLAAAKTISAVTALGRPVGQLLIAVVGLPATASAPHSGPAARSRPRCPPLRPGRGRPSRRRRPGCRATADRIRCSPAPIRSPASSTARSSTPCATPCHRSPTAARLASFSASTVAPVSSVKAVRRASYVACDYASSDAIVPDRSTRAAKPMAMARMSSILTCAVAAARGRPADCQAVLDERRIGRRRAPARRPAWSPRRSASSSVELCAPMSTPST